MIEKNEVLKMAAGLNLNPDTVEKDYVLGWILFGINKHPLISNWIFKGGTSLKKCFFETYRFSEDLDFTLTNSSQLDVDFLLKTFIEITDTLSEEVGIEFFKDKFNFKIIDKGNGKFSAQGKIQYNGPLRRKRGFASIKLDLTSDEILVLKPVIKSVHHPYTDAPPEGIRINCYAFEEVVAEKIRALAQRARPRDVYDVVHFFRNREMIKNPKLVHNTLKKKCEFKRIEFPTFEYIQSHEKLDELEPQWAFMLAHQLPNLPPLESFWDDLPPFFNWINDQLEVEALPFVSNKPEVALNLGRVTNAFSLDSNLQKIQFAASNRVCIVLEYSFKKRIVEPISFRRAQNGNKLFYGFERDADHAKAYSISKIQKVEVTNTPYIEKYPVEINSTGTISMPPIRRKNFGSSRRHSSSRISGYRTPKHKYQCPYCDRYFYRKNRNSKLKKHNDKDGYPCYGRSAIYIGYE